MILGLPDLIFGLIVGIVAGGVMELSVLWFAGRRWIPNRSAEVYNQKAAAGDLDDARDHFIEPIREEIASMKADLTPGEVPDMSQEFEDFEARFTAAYTTDMAAIQEEMEKIPLRISGMIHGTQGVEEKAFRAMVVDAEAEVEGEISLVEATMAQDPRAMQVAIAQKIQKLGGDEEWQKEHPIGAVLLEIAKPQLMGWVQTAAAQMQGIPTARLTPGTSSGKIYGT